jgi:hypothetical protein
MHEISGCVKSNATATDKAHRVGEAPAEPRLPCARHSCSCGSAGASPSQTRLATGKLNVDRPPAACPDTHIFRDILSVASGKARRGIGTRVDEEPRRMKPKSKRGDVRRNSPEGLSE